MTTETADGRNPAEALRRHVQARATALQEGYRRDSPASVATLARLRRALVDDRTLSPDAWEALDGFPPWLMGDHDEPSAAEWACVASLSIFARHVQSRREHGAHRTSAEHAVGRVVGRAAHGRGPGFERRFRALTRVPDHVAALPHLRGIVTLLRGAERPTPIDYGRLAVDLRQLQLPGGARQVQMRWTRDFHRPTPLGNDPENPTDTDSAEPTGDPS